MREGPIELPVYVVMPPRVLLLDLAGPAEVLRKANQVQDRVRFEIRYVGPTADVDSSIGLMLAGVAPLPASVPDGALVMIPGSATIPPPPVADEAPYALAETAIADWLRTAIRPGIRLITICAGALLAARAGLLDGHDCTTHHACCAALADLAPTARVLENRLFVEDGERISSAGITAGIDLMLHLVAKLAGPAPAAAVARHLVVYLRRGGADPQLSPWLEGRNHLHPAVHRVQDAVAADPAHPWDLEALAHVAAASPRHLSRIFNEHAGMSLTSYVNRMRVALAHELLSGSRLDMESVAERAGFGSTRQLRRAWHRFHERPPSQFRAGDAIA